MAKLADTLNPNWARFFYGLQASAKSTKVAGYVDTPIPKKCGTCEHLSSDRKHCDQKDVLRDPQIKSDSKTGTKLVCADNGCCNYWEPK